MRKRSATIVPGAKPRPSAGVETWPTLGEGETSRRAPAGSAVGNREGELAGAPHDEQNRACSGTSAAQLGQRDIARIVSQVACVAQAPCLWGFAGWRRRPSDNEAAPSAG